MTLDWVRRILGASWAELYDTAARPWRPDPSRGPVFLPYLAGERWEHRDSGGAWTGLALAHQRDDLLRAALEGVAFLLRGQLDDLRGAGSAPVRVLLAGGGSRSAAWRQLLADALGVPLQPAADPAAGWLTARGAASSPPGRRAWSPGGPAGPFGPCSGRGGAARDRAAERPTASSVPRA